MDVVSETVLATDTPRYPRHGFLSCLFDGRLDRGALEDAIREALVGFPIWRMRLTTVRRGLTRQYAWAPIEHEPLLLEGASIDSDAGLTTFQDSINERFWDWITRPSDLANGPATRFVLVSFADGRDALSIFCHHAATDAGAIMRFLRDAFSGLHRRVTGQAPDWAGGIELASTGKGRAERPGLRRFVKDLRQEKALAGRGRPTLFAPIRWPERLGRFNVVRQVGPDVLGRLRAACKAAGVALNDLLLAASQVAIDRFDKEAGLSADVIRTVFPVNVRGLMGEAEHAMNQSSGLCVCTVPAERENILSLTRTIRAQREARQANLREVANIIWLRRMVGTLRLFPIGRRRGILRNMMLGQGFTTAMSNPGIIWPRMSDGRPTGESAVTEVGGTRFLGFGFDISVTEGLGQGVTVYTYDGTLNLEFTCAKSRMERDEVERYLDHMESAVLSMI